MAKTRAEKANVSSIDKRARKRPQGRSFKSSCYKMSENGTQIPREKKVLLTVVRHGETDANKQHVLQGQTNYPLNETGQEQAIKAGIKLRDEVFEFTYSSDQTRAFQTAELIMSKNASFLSRGLAPSDVILKDVSLRERHYGVFEGLNVSKMIEEAKKKNFTLREFTPEGGETLYHVQDRVESFYLNLFDKIRSGESDDVRVMVVTHGGWIREMLMLFKDKFGCTFPDEFGPQCHQKLTPNTGIAKFAISLTDDNISNFNCYTLHQRDHLDQVNVSTEATISLEK